MLVKAKVLIKQGILAELLYAVTYTSGKSTTTPYTAGGGKLATGWYYYLPN
jgi:hypothetical protein